VAVDPRRPGSGSHGHDLASPVETACPLVRLSPLFPVIRNAQEHLGLWQFVLFFVVGLVLGVVSESRALVLGALAVVALPLAAFAEMVADPTSHNLWPFEFMFYAFYGASVAAGAALAHRASRRYAGVASGA
jgi:hypothetical protein